MEWPASNLELNPIENLWSIRKMKLYKSGKCNSKADLWVAIKTTMSEIEPTEIKKKLTKSIDNRLLAVIEKTSH